jgi:DNA-binding NtrC family response regulator
MQSGTFEIAIVAGPGAATVRGLLSGLVTTLGSDPAADIRIAGLPGQWGVVTRSGQDWVLRVLASGETVTLVTGRPVRHGGLVVTVSATAEPAAGLPLGRLSDLLGEANGPEQALEGLVEEVVRASGADGGALLLREGEGYRVAVSRQAGGGPLEGAASLLSDSIVRAVLDRVEAVVVPDVRADASYASVPSVVAMRLGSVACVPLVSYGAPIGALFLGSRGAAALSGRVAGDLAVVATMAVPLLVQLRKKRAVPVRAADDLFGDHESMVEVRRLIERIAPSDLSVLVLGPTGSGKEVAARALHRAGKRAAGPFVAINCSAVPESLLASELFGHKKGSFTGALTDRAGRIEDAHGGTLFLDEIGDMPAAMQAALLRALELREVVRVGDTVTRKVDFRLVAATHRDLTAEVAAGRFREDLLFRVAEMTLRLPALATRGDDIVVLAELFLRQTEQELGTGPRRIAPDAERALRRHTWPGNVRELRATMRRAAVLADGAEVHALDLGLPVAAGGSTPPAAPAAAAVDPGLGAFDRPLDEAQRDFVTRYVRAVLDRCAGDRQRAAESLGISVRSLYRYLGQS